MATETIQFEDFLLTVAPPYQVFVSELHEFLLMNDCKVRMGQKSSGYFVSYTHTPSKRVLLNFVFRKKGLVTRIYGDYVNAYLPLLDGFPDAMRKEIEKAPVCKRLTDPQACNPKCAMGYDFTLRGRRFQKCQYNCFMFLVNEESGPYIKEMAEKELQARLLLK